MDGYFGFIASAYAISAVALGGLGLWVLFDARRRQGELKALEAQGVRRRSAAAAGDGR